jgi:hypothetical protein
MIEHVYIKPLQPFVHLISFFQNLQIKIRKITKDNSFTIVQMGLNNINFNIDGKNRNMSYQNAYSTKHSNYPNKLPVDIDNIIAKRTSLIYISLDDNLKRRFGRTTVVISNTCTGSIKLNKNDMKGVYCEWTNGQMLLFDGTFDHYLQEGIGRRATFVMRVAYISTNEKTKNIINELEYEAINQLSKSIENGNILQNTKNRINSINTKHNPYIN